MRHLKWSFYFFSLFFVNTDSFAGDLIQKVQETYRTTPAIEAEFVQKTYVEILEREIEEKGSLILAKPGRFNIHYKGRRERRYISDGKKLWIVHLREKETEVFEDIQKMVSPEALTFLSGLGEMEKDFQVAEDHSGKTDRLILTPRRPESPFKKIVLWIDPKMNLAKEIELYPENGNRSHYRFERIKVKDDIASSLFHP
ncbi:MAG: outer membrane lipoprotein carrier protein LolA [Deltaproteobacteria bacterium]|nr:outer membrane lipoprotein carrier protein LolA [Deltaproteobacteria bacterium]